MLNVLLIDDDPDIVDVITFSLEMRWPNSKVSVGINGESGLLMLESENPQVVILDVSLPGMDGFEVLRKLKEQENTKNIPVIILSNLGQKEDVDKGMELGAKDYMIKAHFTPGEIMEKIKSIVKE